MGALIEQVTIILKYCFNETTTQTLYSNVPPHQRCHIPRLINKYCPLVGGDHIPSLAEWPFSERRVKLGSVLIVLILICKQTLNIQLNTFGTPVICEITLTVETNVICGCDLNE